MRFLWKNVNSQKKVVYISLPKKKRKKGKKKNVGHRIAGTFINLYSMETWKPFYLGRPIEIHRKWNKRRLNGTVRFLSILKAQSTRNIFAYILVENSSVRFLLKFFFLFHEEITIKISTIPSILILLPRTKFHCVSTKIQLSRFFLHFEQPPGPERS